MRKVFVDTHYFVALINTRDQWHQSATAARKQTADAEFITTENILIEVLNFLCEYGPSLRAKVALFVRKVLIDPDFEVVSHKEITLLEGLELYESRLDKGYSLTDCISMNVCRELGIDEILTSDKHFTQEGFTILL